jgi:uncharacterized protein
MNKKKVFAVVGASNNPKKYGNKVFFSLKESGKIVYPVNPKTKFIGKDKSYKKISNLPEKPTMVIMVVKPEITKKIVKECSKEGIKEVWMQPGSESEDAIDFCKKQGIKVINNACVIINEKVKK